MGGRIGIDIDAIVGLRNGTDIVISDRLDIVIRHLDKFRLSVLYS